MTNAIKRAKAVMNKVETEYSNKSVDMGMVNNNSYINENYYDNENFDIEQVRHISNSNNQMPNLSKSKMPKEILESFRRNPVIDPTIPLETENVMNEVVKKVPNTQIKPTRKVSSDTTSLTEDFIKGLIEETVKETIKQMQKTTQINEDFQIKIGDKVFGGKLTVLKENKNNKKTI